MIKTMPFKLWILLTSVMLFFASCSEQQEQFTVDPKYSGIHSIMKESFGGRQPAILLLINDGQIVFRQTYGNIPYNQPLNIELASSWVASAVILHLVEKGHFQLDQPLETFYPEFAGQAAGKISLRHMLSHTSGITPDHPCLNTLFGSLQECALSIGREPLRFQPGTQLQPGYGSYQVAAAMAARAYGKNWQDTYRDVIKFPMKFAFLDYEYGEYYYLPNARAADGLTSSAEEFARFMLLLLNDGWNGSERILNSASIQEFYKVQTGTLMPHIQSSLGFGVATTDLEKAGYGLGVWIEQIESNSGQARRISAPGTFGFIPWMHPSTRSGGILITPGNFNQGWKTYRKMLDELERIGF
jgi:serine-type D-Ala-D-Ala carboxypeptidase